MHINVYQNYHNLKGSFVSQQYLFLLFDLVYLLLYTRKIALFVVSLLEQIKILNQV